MTTPSATAHARALRAHGSTPRPAVCAWCGKPFTAHSPRAKYHTPTCRQYAYLQRKKEASNATL